jgi:hypothetical protein
LWRLIRRQRFKDAPAGGRCSTSHHESEHPDHERHQEGHEQAQRKKTFNEELFPDRAPERHDHLNDEELRQLASLDGESAVIFESAVDDMRRFTAS